MVVKDVAAISNIAFGKLYSGESDITVADDLSNIVDVGTELASAGITKDAILGALADQFATIEFYNRKYIPWVPDVVRDDIEWACIVAEVRAEIPEAETDNAWELTDGQSIDQYVVSLPKVTETLWTKRAAFSVKDTRFKRQLESAFTGPAQYAAFVDMLENRCATARDARTNAEVMWMFCNMAAVMTHANSAIHLVTEYNTDHAGNTVSWPTCLQNPDFMKYFVNRVKDLCDNIKVLSNAFNGKGVMTQTDDSQRRIVYLGAVANAAETYLYGDTYHDGMTKLPEGAKVPMWNATKASGGDRFDITTKSSFKVIDSEGDTVTASKLACIIYDYKAIAMHYNDIHSTITPFNADGEYWNVYYKACVNLSNNFAYNFIPIYFD